MNQGFPELTLNELQVIDGGTLTPLPNGFLILINAHQNPQNRHIE
jgi:hypothetical protein